MKYLIKWLPKVLALVLLWGAVAYTVVMVEPEKVKNIVVPGLYLPFVGVVVTAGWYSALLLTKSFRAAGLLSLIITVTMVTLIYRWMNTLIAISLLGMTVALGLTLVKRS